MRKTITIGGRDFILESNAATCYRYKQVFRKDLFTILRGSADEISMDLFQELAYIMYKQGKGEGKAVSLDDFFTWLEGFEPLDFANASEEIINVYMAQKAETSEAKKKVDLPQES